MKNFLFYMLLISLGACSGENQQQSKSQPINDIDSFQLRSEYFLIRDNLYSDKKGNLYLKSVNNEDFDKAGNLFLRDVWLTTVYCDTCWTPTENGWKDIAILKDFVDTQTWRYDSSNGYWTEYVDKKYRYHLTHMADGGAVTVMKK